MEENLPRSGCSVGRKVSSKEHLKDEWKGWWFELKTSDLGFLQLLRMSPSSFKKGRVRSMSQIPEWNVCLHFPAPQARKQLLILAEGLNVLKTRKRKPLTTKYQLTIISPICLYHSNSETLETKRYDYFRNSRGLLKSVFLASAPYPGLPFPECSFPAWWCGGKGRSRGSAHLQLPSAVTASLLSETTSSGTGNIHFSEKWQAHWHGAC